MPFSVSPVRNKPLISPLEMTDVVSWEMYWCSYKTNRQEKKACILLVYYCILDLYTRVVLCNS